MPKPDYASRRALRGTSRSPMAGRRWRARLSSGRWWRRRTDKPNARRRSECAAAWSRCSPKEHVVVCILYSIFATTNCDPIAGSRLRREEGRGFSVSYVCLFQTLRANLGQENPVGNPAARRLTARQFVYNILKGTAAVPPRGPQPDAGTPSLTRQERDDAAAYGSCGISNGPRKRHQGQERQQGSLQHRLGQRQAEPRAPRALGGEPLPLCRAVRRLSRLHLCADARAIS